MNKLLCATVLAASLSASMSAHAAQPIYLGAALGLSSGEAYLTDGVNTWENTNSPRPFRLNAGYMLNSAFAIEAGYTNSGEFKFSGPARIEQSVMYLAVKGTYPLGQKWAVAGKLGVARSDVDFSGMGADSFSVNDTAAMLSIGTAYRFTPQLAATLDLVNYGSSSKENTSMRSRAIELGLQYNF